VVAPADGSTRHAINPKIQIEYDTGECVDSGDGSCDPDPATLVVKINGGSNLAAAFTKAEWYAQNGTGNAGVHNFPVNQWSTVYASICNGQDECADASISVYIQSAPQPAVAIGAQNPSVYDPGACEAVAVAPGAAFACDAVVISHGIPGYVSQDAGRSVAVVYSSRSALGQVTLPVGVSLIWDAAATTVQAWVAGQSSTYWNGPDWDGTGGSVTRRIVLAKPESTQVGGYIGRQLLTVTARAQTAVGVYDVTKVDSVPFFFERDSLTTPIARGWGIAGLSRIYGGGGHQPGGGDPMGAVLLVQAGGGIAYYKYLSTTGDTISYGRPAGMFATLKKSNSTDRWILLSIDGTRQYYSWVSGLGYARLDSIGTVRGTTTVAYRSGGSGSPTTITDPQGQQIRFDYYTGSGVGKLQRICAPAGANERCTSFSYGTSGGNTVVSAITDPDGGQVTFGYAGTPHWAAVTSYTPRARGTYTLTYHSAIPRPSGVVFPAPGTDTLGYLAPQLAGAALVGGTSGNPAASADATAPWGQVRQPLGQTRSFAADWLGHVTQTKGQDNVVTWFYRNTAGQVLWVQQGSQVLRRWEYNAVGALTKVYAESGDTNRISYSGACAAGTGYPCRLTQLVVSRSPIVPDTTKWFNSASGVVDSVYRSGLGTTRLWYGGDTRVDSVADPVGHMQYLQYESTWGNVAAIGGKNKGLCVEEPGLPQCLSDTLSVLYNETGRVKWGRQGAAGGRVLFAYDLLGRDTVVTDSGTGTTPVTTKTRFNDGARTVTVVDGLGRTVVFLSDARGRTIRQTDAAGARDTFAYDGNDRLIKWQTRRGDSLAYAYDSLSRLRTKTVSGGGGGTWTYGYHGTYGTLDTLLNPAASVYRVYNTRGWLTQEKTVVHGVTRIVKYAYNQGGGLDTLTDPWNGAYRFGWDVANRARTLTTPFSESFSIRHNQDGRVTSVVFPTGLDSLRYNANHQPIAAGLSAEVSYTRNAVTKGIKQFTFAGVTQRFTYDAFGRLGSDSVSTTGYGPTQETFTYDAAGNRTGTGYSYTVTNAVRGRPAISGDGWAPGDSLMYDAAGNPVWWKNTTTSGYDSLTWDAEDRLIRLRRYNASNQLQLDVNYAYDGLGRRVKKDGEPLADRLYVWNGWELLAETDLSGNATRRYTHHPERVDFPLAMREGSTTSLFHLDGQGNVYLLTDTSGTRRSEYRYRAWGDRYVTPVGEGVQSPFGYKGREEDRETGLVYLRLRYYSPRLERFVNEDPIGLAGGLNKFAFVGADPVNRGDPLGLDWDPCWWIGRLYAQCNAIQVVWTDAPFLAGWSGGVGGGGGGGGGGGEGPEKLAGVLEGGGGAWSGDNGPRATGRSQANASTESVGQCMSRNFAPVAGAAAAAGTTVTAMGGALIARGRSLYEDAVGAWGPVKHITRVLAFPGGELIGTVVVAQTAGSSLRGMGTALLRAGLPLIVLGASYLGATAVGCKAGAL
jgi:RHS repeat-associated protein